MLAVVARVLAHRVPYRHLLLALVLMVSACHKRESGKHLEGERVKAACAMCIFKMKGIRACMWAVEIDGKFYVADGKVPKNHQNHAPDGMCNMARHAIVDGDLVGGRFVASRFDLEPAVGVPKDPRFTKEGVH